MTSEGRDDHTGDHSGSGGRVVMDYNGVVTEWRTRPMETVWDVEAERDIEELCDEIAEVPVNNTLTAAAYMHLKFESIHLFADGNGRAGRTLMNYYLMTHEYPPTVIYEEDKKTYYMALAVYDKTEEISGFEEFIKEQTVKTWSRASRPIRTLSWFV